MAVLIKIRMEYLLRVILRRNLAVRGKPCL